MKNNKMSAIFSNQHEYKELKPLTDERSLSTLAFAGKYRLMDFPLSSIVNAGINNVYALINQEKVRSYFDHLGGGKEWGLDTIGSYDYIDFYQKIIQRQVSGEPYFADIIEFLKTTSYPYAVFIGNKMVGNFDLQSVLHYHQENGNKITGVFKKVKHDRLAFDDQVFVLDNNNNILANQQMMDTQKQFEYNLSLNIYIVNTDWILKQLEKAQMSDSTADISKLLAALAAKYRSTAYEYTGYLRNIRDIKSYFNANMDMLDQKQFASLLQGNQKVITRIRNEVGNYYSAGSIVKNSIFGTGCRVFGKVKHSVISRRVEIDKNSWVLNSIVMSSVNIKKGAHVEYAILDKDVTIEAGVTIKGTLEKPIVIRKYDDVNDDWIRNRG
ncbi:glucose-1-phosphate adenylyltransferase subunit GlgD [Lactobacillus kefiranofaciens]|uniref:glucose-1-phosphate adenylyltransferase subunit GlgD n=1 Tax=Lactobacillus kefiranofaciens TaxID=267818 RepID=UPI0024697B43|nr:glucose-1-phosphate adenylyltransferase subunit GlgD [Lactobacillus kefiranofaciens]MDH5099940.1 glucose-1-phosphate adenylyltransferase subunit GlgD [Lactobacillus kefiranofaciens]